LFGLSRWQIFICVLLHRIDQPAAIFAKSAAGGLQRAREETLAIPPALRVRVPASRIMSTSPRAARNPVPHVSRAFAYPRSRGMENGCPFSRVELRACGETSSAVPSVEIIVAKKEISVCFAPWPECVQEPAGCTFCPRFIAAKGTITRDGQVPARLWAPAKRPWPP